MLSLAGPSYGYFAPLVPHLAPHSLDEECEPLITVAISSLSPTFSSLPSLDKRHFSILSTGSQTDEVMETTGSNLEELDQVVSLEGRKPEPFVVQTVGALVSINDIIKQAVSPVASETQMAGVTSENATVSTSMTLVKESELISASVKANSQGWFEYTIINNIHEDDDTLSEEQNIEAAEDKLKVVMKGFEVAKKMLPDDQRTVCDVDGHRIGSIKLSKSFQYFKTHPQRILYSTLDK